eukprot:Hpha_TRINITY_DN33862_c0_g1::TRINITY_DN33862_c0_g1_i1::g.27343::m.27343
MALVVYVVMPDDSRLVSELAPDARVADLADFVQQQSHRKVRLIFQGVSLDPSTPLADSGISNEATVEAAFHNAWKWRGKKPGETAVMANNKLRSGLYDVLDEGKTIAKARELSGTYNTVADPEDEGESAQRIIEFALRVKNIPTGQGTDQFDAIGFIDMAEADVQYLDPAGVYIHLHKHPAFFSATKQQGDVLVERDVMVGDVFSFRAERDASGYTATVLMRDGAGLLLGTRTGHLGGTDVRPAIKVRKNWTFQMQP